MKTDPRFQTRVVSWRIDRQKAQTPPFSFAVHLLGDSDPEPLDSSNDSESSIGARLVLHLQELAPEKVQQKQSPEIEADVGYDLESKIHIRAQSLALRECLLRK